MKTIVSLLVLMVASAVAAANPEKESNGKALAGDYQAQRNLAYGYATGGWGQKKDQHLACAWYLLVLRSDSQKLNVGDVGNVVTYCNNLDLERRLAAERKANALYQEIYRKK